MEDRKLSPAMVMASSSMQNAFALHDDWTLKLCPRIDLSPSLLLCCCWASHAAERIWVMWGSIFRQEAAASGAWRKKAPTMTWTQKRPHWWWHEVILKDKLKFHKKTGRGRPSLNEGIMKAVSEGDGQGGCLGFWGILPRLGRKRRSCKTMFSDPVITFTLGKRIMPKWKRFFSRAQILPWTQPQRLSMSCLARPFH